jgi:hypothetical protein
LDVVELSRQNLETGVIEKGEQVCPRKVLHDMDLRVCFTTLEFLQLLFRNEEFKLRLHIQQVISLKLTGGALADLFLLDGNWSS